MRGRRQPAGTKRGPPGRTADSRRRRSPLLDGAVFVDQSCLLAGAARAARKQQRMAPAGASPTFELENSWGP